MTQPEGKKARLRNNNKTVNHWKIEHAIKVKKVKAFNQINRLFRRL